MARRLGLLTILALLAAAGPAAAAPITLTDGIWATFDWFNLGPIADPADGFLVNVPTGFQGRLRVVDCCVIGDQFEVFDNGGSLFTTGAFTGDGVQSNAVLGDVAWADGRLSHGEAFLFGSGHQIDINVTRLALETTQGDAFIRVDFEQVVPEPGTLGLLGLGLTALRMRGKRRQRNA